MRAFLGKQSRHLLERSERIGGKRHFGDRGYLRTDFSDSGFRKKGYTDPGNFSYTLQVKESGKSWKPPQFVGESYDDRRQRRQQQDWDEAGRTRRYSGDGYSSYPFTGASLDQYPSRSRNHAGDEYVQDGVSEYFENEFGKAPAAETKKKNRKKDEDESEEEDNELVIQDRFAIRKTLAEDADDLLQTFHKADGRLFDIVGNMDENWQPSPADDALVYEMRALFRQGNVATWEAEDVVRSYGGQLRPYHVFELIKSCKAADCTTALAFFKWAGLQQNFEHVTETYNIMLKLLQEGKKYYEMVELAREMEQTEVEKSKETYKILMLAFFKGGFLEEGLEALDQMEKAGIVPALKVYKFVIDRLLASECYAVVPVLFNNLVASGRVPDAYAYNAVISSLCNIAQMDQALKVFEDMRSKSVIDMFTYTILIDGYIKCHNVSGATNMFMDMLERGCLPGEEIFNLLFGLHAKSGEIEQAVGLFRKITDHGCRPTVKSYAMLVDTFSMVDNLEGACSFFRELIGKKVYPNTISINNLLSKLNKAGKIGRALDLYKDMKLLPDCKPNSITYNIGIDLYGKTGRFSQAWNEFEEMKRKGCSPCSITYNTLIIRLGRGGLIENCFDLFEEMRSRGITPNQYTYCGLIDVLTRYNLTDQAAEMLQEMKQKDLTPSFNVLQLVIKALWNSGDLGAAKRLCEQYPGVYSTELEKCRPQFMAIADHTGARQISRANSLNAAADSAQQLSYYASLLER